MAEKREKVYPKGLLTFKKNEKAPDFVKGTLVIDINKLIEWINGEGSKWMTDYKGDPQLRCQVTEWEGKINIEVDTFRKGGE